MFHRNGWGVTCVDSLSTAIVMNEKESLVQIMDCIKNIDFDATDEAKGYISVFETNIRYLGGLLSGIATRLLSSIMSAKS